MTRLCFETGHTDSRYHSNCVFPHHFRHCHALCIDAAVTGDAYWESLFGSPARKGWDEASARRFAPYPALCGASRCSVFVIALYEIARIVPRSETHCQYTSPGRFVFLQVCTFSGFSPGMSVFLLCLACGALFFFVILIRTGGASHEKRAAIPVSLQGL